MNKLFTGVHVKLNIWVRIGTGERLGAEMVVRWCGCERPGTSALLPVLRITRVNTFGRKRHRAGSRLNTSVSKATTSIPTRNSQLTAYLKPTCTPFPHPPKPSTYHKYAPTQLPANLIPVEKRTEDSHTHALFITPQTTSSLPSVFHILVFSLNLCKTHFIHRPRNKRNHTRSC